MRHKTEIYKYKIFGFVPLEIMDLPSCAQFFLFGKKFFEKRKKHSDLKNISLSKAEKQLLIEKEASILHKKTFTRYKELFKNKEMVLVATGPSLANYKPIKNAIHVGVNGAFKCEAIDFDFLFIQDYSGSKDYMDELCGYKKGKAEKFFGISHFSIPEICYIPDELAKKANAKRYYLGPCDYKYTADLLNKPLGDGFSIVFATLQFMLWCAPKKIYIVGCDCSEAGYFNSSKLNTLQTQNVMVGWNIFKEFAQQNYPQTEIISINPIGLKGLFKDIEQNKEMYAVV